MTQPANQPLAYTADRVYDGLGGCLERTAVLFDPGSRQVLALEPAYRHPGAFRVPGSLAPGLINAHGHLELSHLAGRLAPGGGLIPFLEAVAQSRGADPLAEVQQAARQAADALWQQGVVAMGDIANTADVLPVKCESRLRFFTFVEVFGMSRSGMDRALERGLPVLEAHREAGLRAVLSPHAPYSVHPAWMGALCGRAGAEPLSIHMQECADEGLLFAAGEGGFVLFYGRLGVPAELPPSGTHPLDAVLGGLVPGQRMLLVHNTLASLGDLQRSAFSAAAISWCLCPGANRYLEGRLPDIGLFRAWPDRVLVGTDSAASNTGLSLIDELILLLQADPRLSPAMALQWACANPARFFGWQDSLGSLEPGKAPGLVHISPARDGSPLGAGSRSRLLLAPGS